MWSIGLLADVYNGTIQTFNSAMYCKLEECGLETKHCDLGLRPGLEEFLFWSQSLWSWSWQSVADLDGVVHPVLVLNLSFCHCKLIHITITHYWKLIGQTAKRHEDSTYKY